MLSTLPQCAEPTVGSRVDNALHEFTNHDRGIRDARMPDLYDLLASGEFTIDGLPIPAAITEVLRAINFMSDEARS